MIIIPELEIVIICPPKTASTSVLQSFSEKFEVISPYKHGEITLIPSEYLSYKKYGLFRHPKPRLWSFYKMGRKKFLKEQGTRTDLSYNTKSFEKWLTTSNRIVGQDFNQNKIKEVEKSLKYYLGADDNNVEIIDISVVNQFLSLYGLKTKKLNKTDNVPVPESEIFDQHIEKHFQWDIGIYNKIMRKG